MSKSISELIDQVQALFVDDGTRFTDALCTAAISQALKDFNSASPRQAAEVITAVSGQYEYELTDTTAMLILDVLRQGDDALAEIHKKLGYNAYFEDERPFFRLHVAQASGYLICRYTIPHTIDGLDSAVESTLPAVFDPILVDGACYRCALAPRGRPHRTYQPEYGRAEVLAANSSDVLQRLREWPAHGWPPPRPRPAPAGRLESVKVSSPVLQS